MSLYLFPGFCSHLFYHLFGEGGADIFYCFWFQRALESRLEKAWNYANLLVARLNICGHPPSFQVWDIAFTLFGRSLIWLILILDAMMRWLWWKSWFSENSAVDENGFDCWLIICVSFFNAKAQGMYYFWRMIMIFMVTHFVGAVVLYVKAQGVTSRKRI